jgi:excisionase family DNA binding protein
MTTNLTPLFLRLPKNQVAALNRLATATGRAKQHVVSEIVGQLLTAQSRSVSVGRIEPAAYETPEDGVLTLDEVAALLKVPADAVRSRAEEGDLPARRLGDEWRFSKLAVLAWLADGDKPDTKRRSRAT